MTSPGAAAVAVATAAGEGMLLEKEERKMAISRKNIHILNSGLTKNLRLT